MTRTVALSDGDSCDRSSCTRCGVESRLVHAYLDEDSGIVGGLKTTSKFAGSGTNEAATVSVNCLMH